MPGYKRIDPEIKKEILRKMKEEGAAAKDLSIQYGCKVNTIYSWLSPEQNGGISLLEINRLKKENQYLTEMIGLLTIANAKQKKGIPPERWFQS